MKKFLVLAMVFSLSFNAVIARDYAKLQLKEAKHAQKYGTTKMILQDETKTSNNYVPASYNVKDPQIMKIGDYEVISDAQFDAKKKAEEKEYLGYSKQMGKKSSTQYRTQADAEDFYKVYRIAENIIRANNLDYINWRICIYKDTENPNAYTNSVNYVAISTSLLDTFYNNDDAMAMVIGHEMGHALLGHSKRTNQLVSKMNRMARQVQMGNTYAALAYEGMRRKFLIDSKNMEYAADVEGAKLAMKAGYSLDNGADVLKFLQTFDMDRDFRRDHPSCDKRLENLNQNRRYFPEQWKDMGRYNIYESNVMPVKLSSDRKSMVISAPTNKLDPNRYYSPETPEEIYARLGYMCYKNGEFEKSLGYFDNLFKTDKKNASAYLYASYASEYLYKNTGNSKYLKLAKSYAEQAKKLDGNNKYINEQIESL